MENTDNPLLQAAEILKKGGIVVFPTETVYGLGADVFNEKAVRKIFKAKGRPADNPLIVHIADLKDLKKVARAAPAVAKKLIAAFWPGPLTLILKKAPTIPDVVTAGLDTVAVRLPNHALARALIRAAGAPIAAPSANRSGGPSPTEVAHAKKDLQGKVDFFLSAERTRHGVESTVINVLVRPPLILRHGAITREEIEKVIGKVSVVTGGERQAARSPGMRHKHYAPQTPLALATAAESVHMLVARYHLKNKKVGVLGTREQYQQYKTADRVILLGSQKNPRACAGALFKALRDFDRFNDVDVIIAEPFAEAGMGAVIMDRLKRAAR